MLIEEMVARGSLQAEAARNGQRDVLAAALRGARETSLALFAAYEAALGPAMRVPQTPELNLPLWELGHIAWFADWWLARNPHRALGLACDPDALRSPARRAGADALYNSSLVSHASRWSLALPGAAEVRHDLHASLNDTLALLANTQDDDDQALYFFRLALFHEDMHTEAAVYMAQTLGLNPFTHGAQPQPVAVTAPSRPLDLPATRWTLGRAAPHGFSFDNELPAHAVAVAACQIDSAPITWAQHLPFVESGAADQRAHWSEAGWAWRQRQPSAVPRYLRREGGGDWQALRFGQWQALDPQASARHLTAHEAQAWCHWAQRRLPTEAEWEAAAHTLPGFEWGTVWEWTASAFEGFPGFEAHPYRDYSQPWFDGRPVLKGASPATAPRMRHARYRNYFPPERNDILSGFRCVAL